ncbi:MAG: hypothetical protein ABXS93_07380 [Sulfurimonas sp.]
MKTLMSLLLLSSLGFGATLSNKPTDSSLVVYNANRALVHETRDLKLSRDDTLIVYDNVASTINTDSVSIKLPQGITLYSQQYKYDKLSLQKMLDAHIGKEIELKKKKSKTQRATLLSANGKSALIRTKEGNIFTTKVKDIVFKNIPNTLITKPSLVWNIKTDKKIDAEMELNYLLKNISFKSDYILDLSDDSADLNGWITINNHSGKAFHNTALSLLAGDVNFVANYTPRTYKAVAALAERDTTAQHQAFQGYHFYKIPFRVDIANNEKTQLKFLTLDRLKYKKHYKVQTRNPLYLQGEQKSDVMQHVVLQKLEDVLPKGVVRVYSKLKGQTILLGESSISHTPKNTEIDLPIGKEFDLKLTQTLLEKQKSKHRLESKVLYTLTNNSDETKTFEIYVPFSKDKSAKVSSKENYTFTKGNLVTFGVTVQPNATKKFTAKFKINRNR